MEESLKTSLVIVCKLLDTYNVKYMLVGGTAVALNGYYRHSVNMVGELTSKPDIDIWYNPNYENYFNILKFMDALGVDVTEFKNEQSPTPRKSFFKLELSDFSLDILPEIKTTIKFTDANQRKETIEIDGIPIHFISFFDLISEKETSGRKKDLEDIKQLKRIKGKE